MRSGFIKVFVFCCCVFAFMQLFVTAEVSGSSMYPTCKEDDFLFCIKYGVVHHGDIVAVYSDTLNKILCKRVIGVSGDTISIHDASVVRNNERLDEPYLNSGSWAGDIDITVPDGKVFLLGDNRGVSLDSRSVGCLDSSDIRGICLVNITRLFGVTRMQLIKIAICFWMIYLIVGVVRKNAVRVGNGRKSDGETSREE